MEEIHWDGSEAQSRMNNAIKYAKAQSVIKEYKQFICFRQIKLIFLWNWVVLSVSRKWVFFIGFLFYFPSFFLVWKWYKKKRSWRTMIFRLIGQFLTLLNISFDIYQFHFRYSCILLLLGKCWDYIGISNVFTKLLTVKVKKSKQCCWRLFA